MFNKNTILILGAGASEHYGYPIGEELVNDVIKKITTIKPHIKAHKERVINFQPLILDSDYQHHEIYKKFLRTDGLSWDDLMNPLTNLQNLLTSLRPLNIDSFLRYNKQYAPLAKTLIADILLKNARPTQPNKEEDWYRYLFHALTYGCKVDQKDTSGNPDIEFSIKNLTIITFNYDTSLEQYLHKAFKNVQAFKDRADDLIALLGKQIHHVYGKLQDKEFYDLGLCQKNDINKINKERPQYVEKSAEQIDTIGGEKPQKPLLKEILPTDPNQHSRVIILGYGFDEENNQNIGLTFEKYCQQNVRFAYTNLDNSQRIERKFIPNPDYRHSWHLETARFEKSTCKVAKALQKDFDLTW
jgi:hypothetical protein